MGKATAERVTRLLNEMETLRRYRRYYPEGHPSVEPVVQRILKRATELEAEGESTLVLGKDKVFWDKDEIPLPPAAPANRLVRFLFHLGLAGMRLALPKGAEGLAGFTAKLAELRDPPGEADREALLAVAEDFPGVVLVPVDPGAIHLRISESVSNLTSPHLIWKQLVDRLSLMSTERSGAITIDNLTPEGLAALVSSSSDPEGVLDVFFSQLADLLLSGPHNRAAVLDVLRAVFDELLPLLDPARRHLAVTVAARHLPVDGEEGKPETAPVDAAVLLDAVDFLLARRWPVPDALLRFVRALVEMPNEDIDGTRAFLALRAHALLRRIGDTAPAASESAAPEIPGVDWAEAAWGRELVAAGAESRVRVHLLRVLGEAVSLWPEDQAASRAALRLASEFVDALEYGDFDSATRLAPLLAASHEPEARRIAARDGVPAAVQAYTLYGPDHHQTISAILVALGEPALPAILEALAESGDLTVRKRLLSAVARHEDRAIPYVRPLLDDERWFVVRNAVFVLRKIGDPELAELIKVHLPTAHPQVLSEMLKALVASEDPAWPRLILREIDGEDAERRDAALRVASRIPNDALAAALASRLRARLGMRLREPFSFQLINALRTMRSPESLEVLQEIVALRQWRYPFPINSLRREAALAVAAIPTPEARAVAESLTQDRDETLANAVRGALRTTPVARSEP